MTIPLVEYKDLVKHNGSETSTKTPYGKCLACYEYLSFPEETFIIDNEQNYYLNLRIDLLEGQMIRYRVIAPHLKRTCRRCGYSWPEKFHTCLPK